MFNRIWSGHVTWTRFNLKIESKGREIKLVGGSSKKEKHADDEINWILSFKDLSVIPFENLLLCVHLFIYTGRNPRRLSQVLKI